MAMDTCVKQGFNFTKKDLSMSAVKWKDKHGYWIAHPGYPISDWKSEVINNDTRQGYWEWAIQQDEEG